MAKDTKIEWADDSVNFWWGCVEVGPGCDNCYAREWAKKCGRDVWGAYEPRWVLPKAFARLKSFQAQAAAEGKRRRVFLNSMSDLAEILPVIHPQFDEIRKVQHAALLEMGSGKYPDLDLIWLTKRIGNVAKVVPAGWLEGKWPANLWMVPTITNQKEADRDIPKLLALPSPVKGLSMEPLLGPVDLTKLFGTAVHSIQPGSMVSSFTPDGVTVAFTPTQTSTLVNWVIVGGESGPNARPMHPQWARDLRDQCQAAGVPFFFKQWGEWCPGTIVADFMPISLEAAWIDDHEARILHTRRVPATEEMHWEDEPDVYRLGKHRAGRQLDGRTWDEFPEVAL